jgi:serine/threonine-protein kinase RsbT
MGVVRSERRAVRASEDVVAVRQAVRECAVTAGFSLVDQTKLVTAASELARNTIVYGGGGTVELQELNGPRRGIRLVFEDAGPGIRDVDAVLKDGYSTGGGLGLGLGGAKRLSNEFEITSRPGEGTRVSITATANVPARRFAIEDSSHAGRCDERRRARGPALGAGESDTAVWRCS